MIKCINMINKKTTISKWRNSSICYLFGPNTPGCNESFWLNQCSQVQVLLCQDMFTKAYVLVTTSNLSDITNKQENNSFPSLPTSAKAFFLLLCQADMALNDKRCL